MATDLRTLSSQARDVWGKLPRRRKAVIVGAIVATVVVVAWLQRGPATRHAVLYAGLEQQDAGEIVRELQARGVPYRLEAGGTAISVPADRVLELRLALAEGGIPQGGGVGFEVFDKQSFGTTSFVEQMNFRRALQGELTRTIASLDAVDGARVHLALGDRSVFRDDDQPPAASVVLRLRRGRALTPAQVRGVVHLVAASVDGMAAERVTVVDERGNVLSSPDGAAGAGEGAEDQASLERSLARRIEEILERIVGAGHVAVSVTATLDHSQVATTEELYADTPVPRSQSRTEERQAGAGPGAGAGGVAGTRGNLPGAPAPSVATDPGLVRIEETHNYEVSRTVRNTTGPKVQLARLSVAILLDVPRGPDGTPGTRSAEELAQIEELARQAAGLDPARGDKISVHATAFTVDPEEAVATTAPARASGLPLGVPMWAAGAAGGGLLVVGAAIAALVLRRRRRRQQGAAVVPALPITVSQLERSLDGGAPSPLALPDRTARERAIEAARADAAQAARVLSRWLTDGAPAAAPTPSPPGVPS